MKLGFICPSSPEPVGGVIVLYELANGLARRGHVVHIGHVSPWGQPVTGVADMPWFTFDPGIRHHFTDTDDATEGEAVVVDVVFGAVTHRTPVDALPAGLIQGFDMLGPEIETEWFRHPGLKVVVASWLVDAARHLGTPAEQCVIVPPGIPLDTFRIQTPVHDRPAAVAMLGHNHPAKGTRIGLAALEQVHAARPDVQVVLFRAHEIDHPVPPWVEQISAPDHQGLSRLLNRCSIFLQPSIYEGFGLTAVEAMASGCALVSTDNGGSRDYAFADRTAVVTDRGDADALARAARRRRRRRRHWRRPPARATVHVGRECPPPRGRAGDLHRRSRALPRPAWPQPPGRRSRPGQLGHHGAERHTRHRPSEPIVTAPDRYDPRAHRASGPSHG